jgi:hypothetical protein
MVKTDQRRSFNSGICMLRTSKGDDGNVESDQHANRVDPKTSLQIEKLEEQKRSDRVANDAAEQAGKTEQRYDLAIARCLLALWRWRRRKLPVLVLCSSRRMETCRAWVSLRRRMTRTTPQKEKVLLTAQLLGLYLSFRGCDAPVGAGCIS